MASRAILFGLVLLVVIAVVVGLRVLGPGGEETGNGDDTAAVQNHPTNRSVPQVQIWLKENVKDREFRITEWGDVERTETGYEVWVKYLSKNQMGGAVVVRRTFKFDAEGNITSAF